jgi:hypothetical protein
LVVDAADTLLLLLLLLLVLVLLLLWLLLLWLLLLSHTCDCLSPHVPTISYNEHPHSPHHSSPTTTTILPHHRSSSYNKLVAKGFASLKYVDLLNKCQAAAAAGDAGDAEGFDAFLEPFTPGTGSKAPADYEVTPSVESDLIFLFN